MNITQQAKLALAQADANGDGTMQGNTALLDGGAQDCWKKTIQHRNPMVRFCEDSLLYGSQVCVVPPLDKRNSQITIRLSAR